MSATPENEDSLGRRDFIFRLGLGFGVLASSSGAGLLCQAAEGLKIPIVLFSKACQPLKLSFDQTADFIAEAGPDGIDCPVRPDGEIAPERVADELPVYVEALRKRGLSMPDITTAITALDSPQAETILRTAKKLGIKRYRLGFMFRSTDEPWEKQLREVKDRLSGLAALNKQIGIGAVLQNHSPAGKSYVGGNLDELAEIVEGFDPEQVGVAFDIAHALNVHGQGWRQRFARIKPHLKVVYIKDTDREKRFVPLGRGEVGAAGYFPVLKQAGYHAPISLHIEYSGAPVAQPQTRAELLKAIQESQRVLKSWLA